MELLFECSTRYLTSERGERVRYRVEHEKRNSISKGNHVLFCLLSKEKKKEGRYANKIPKSEIRSKSLKAEFMN